jgi:hypothetical protein
MDIPKLLGYTQFKYLTLDHYLLENKDKMFLTFAMFDFIPRRVFSTSLLRCQAGEEEIDFFPHISRVFVDKSCSGSISISNLRVIWFSSENSAQNISFYFTPPLDFLALFLSCSDWTGFSLTNSCSISVENRRH